MTLRRIQYVGQAVADRLTDSIDENIDRYLEYGFDDLVEEGNWEIATNLTYDPSPLRDLSAEKTAEAERENSKLVWRSLRALTPDLATENRIWIRFTHLDCLDFCRRRWLSSADSLSAQRAAIRKHFFADTRTGWRDDNAVSRLWWNYWIAKRLWPEDPEQALDTLIHVLDTRLSTIERPGLFIRPPVAAGIIRQFAREKWLLGNSERWQTFMRTLNKLGSGKVFEAMSEAEIDEFMAKCLSKTRQLVD